MESASFYDNCYAGHFLAAPAVFQSLELCGSTGNDVCGFSMYSGYRCCDSADIASELGDMYPVPRSFYILYGLFLFVLVMGCRYSYRGLRVLRNMRRAGVYRRNVLVIGAGDAGNQIIKEINNSRYVKKKVVGVIDDDRNKIGNYIHGAKVVGDRSDILEKVEELHVHEIIIAMPSATQKQIKGILDICKETRCTLKRLPGIYQLVNGDVSVSKLKDVDVNDLLGRDPVTVDLQSIMDYVSGKIIMVTGAVAPSEANCAGRLPHTSQNS